MSVHDEEEKDERNPLLFPTVQSKRLRGCPVCKHPDYSGRNVQGVVTYTCDNPQCKNKWHGGLPQLPIDPTVPLPPVDPKDLPLVDFVRGSHGEVVEKRRPVNTTQEFRKGLPIPTGEE